MIDWNRLNTLRADIGEEDFADVAALFVSEIGECLDRLQAAPHLVGSEDFHFLRGSASNLGFRQLESACSAAELACKSGQPPPIDQIVSLFAQSVAEVTAHIPTLQDAA